MAGRTMLPAVSGHIVESSSGRGTLAQSILIGKSTGRAEIRISLGQARHVAQVTVGSLPTDMTVVFHQISSRFLQSKGATALGAMARLPAKAGLNSRFSVTTSRQTTK